MIKKTEVSTLNPKPCIAFEGRDSKSSGSVFRVTVNVIPLLEKWACLNNVGPFLVGFGVAYPSSLKWIEYGYMGILLEYTQNHILST